MSTPNIILFNLLVKVVAFPFEKTNKRFGVYSEMDSHKKLKELYTCGYMLPKERLI